MNSTSIPPIPLIFHPPKRHPPSPLITLPLCLSPMLHNRLAKPQHHKNV